VTRVKVRALRAELGNILGTVCERPVTITKHGNDIAVIISPNAYAEYMRLRSVYTNVSSRREVRLVSCV
jgi:prevent-host-death family protein